MVPIHESDVAENRWNESEWRQFELWERIELRLKRKKNWTIFGVVVVFIAILSLPIFQDRMPKWRALKAMRILAVKANQMKVDAASLGVPLRLRIENSNEGPNFVVEKVMNCTTEGTASAKEWGRGPVFIHPSSAINYVALTEESAKELGLTRVSQSLCYDPSSPLVGNEETRALGVLTVNDLAEKRLDRISFLNFSGLFAEIDFD
ncbi:MAG: hypothetical protein H7301_13260 [Cryobacterium sp.]|nr:hypothetical protein [Oligoflexia bacterium]